MQKILLIDNYDSFTFNLVQQIQNIQRSEIIVKRNDEMSISSREGFDKLIISPGPKTPKDAGVSKELIKKYYKQIPVLGVCLGMQCINEVFGGKTVHTPVPLHGKTSQLQHNEKGLFQNVPQNIKVARYHSLIIDDIPEELSITATVDDLPKELKVTATVNKLPMAIQHKKIPIFGVQFHPESFMTEYGHTIMKNFLNI